MGERFDIDAALRSHDWVRTIRAGVDMASEQVRRDVELKETDVIWALLCNAVRVSGIAYSGPPVTGFPNKSAMPEASRDITYWQQISAYLRGEVEEIDAGASRHPMPSAEEISRAEVILDVWHRYALASKGDRSRLKRAVYLKATGRKDRAVRAITGYTRQQIHNAKTQAMGDMWEIIRRH